MAEYICLVESPNTVSGESRITYPIVVRVPPLAPMSPRGSGHADSDEILRRNQHPEKWMLENVLPKHPGSVVTLFYSDVTYEPSSHKKRGE